MFEKKCKYCNRKISRDFDFCPYCGANFGKERDKRDFGFLGKDDFLGLDNIGFNMPLDGLFSSLMKQINSEIKQIDKESLKKLPIKSNSISISISTSNNQQPQIKISGFPNEKEKKIENKISEEKIRELAKLPREEAQTFVRRLSNKIIYEISLPGISSLKDILINKLENSFEVKAFAKNKVYTKLIQINLPLLDYRIEKEKLVLEFKAK